MLRLWINNKTHNLYESLIKELYQNRNMINEPILESLDVIYLLYIIIVVFVDLEFAKLNMICIEVIKIIKILIE